MGHLQRCATSLTRMPLCPARIEASLCQVDGLGRVGVSRTSFVGWGSAVPSRRPPLLWIGVAT